ncbi:MAG: putative transcriptional regulator, Crp/Fnr family [Firmicutes bacterium]|nr:putative transcriptional regulator, Crp/Fnr family [Bacillota bacterium]MBP2641413.1 putative transcriptional regulator, Crp/Fnr family [Bacillota bacterium]
MEKSASSTPFIHGNNALLKVFMENLKQSIMLKKGEQFLPQLYDTMICLIKKGRVKVALSNEEGEDKLMWFLNENCIISTFSKCFFQEIVALEATEVLLIDKVVFFDFIRSDQQYLDIFLNQIYRRYEYCIDSLLIQNKINSKMKVYTLLQQLGKLYGTVQPDNSQYIKSFLTRNEMSSITGVHRSNIIKYLTELERLDVIEKSGKVIIIKKPQLLDELIKAEE